ncbi:MAG: DUF423 domain-containing protein [Planctomycetota bacterium]|nr:DUF423 domain-containing protein [Planctomycetota bacterium]
MNLPRIWIVLAGGLAAAAVSIGAYHAHGLEAALAKRNLDADVMQSRMDNCALAARYQMTHALALLALGLARTRVVSRVADGAAVLMCLGLVGFSGGLYASVAGIALHWAIVPLGGVALIASWVVVALAGWGRLGNCQASAAAT